MHFQGRARSDAQELRDEVRKATVPVVRSTSTSPRLCGFCKVWRTPKPDGRCPHCRQAIATLPLVGLKAAG